ncbi:MAG: VCBS domain-containing protein, partial [Planctomycetota bacterium]
RGVTVHGTHNLLIQDVVLHDIHGHGFFMEDAVENGNNFLSNITFGIHAVGQANGNINLADPFIVDTHDHVGQNRTRFLSSAGFWMTNPANIWIGNISAGSEGTGFWFIFPDSAIGESALDPQYANVRPDRTNLWTFDNNSSHSSPVGLNFDRGSDLEVPVGAPLKANFDGDEHRPSQEPQINNYTAYKHTTGIYHRGRTANFNGTSFADNFTGTFITFTQRITNTLYVGHSRGNANLNDIVTGHTFYDGANTMAGNHFAGYTANNAHMFRAEGAAQRLVHFVMSDTSFEDDGSANNVSFSNPQGFQSYGPVGKTMPAVIYDVDGTFTGHVGGGAGSTIVPNNPFFYNSNDFRPAGWNAVVSDDLYAMFRMQGDGSANPLFRVTSPDGFSGEARPGTGQFNGTNTLMKRSDGDYTVSFPEGLGVISGGFRIKYDTLVGPNDGSTMVRFANVAQTVTLNNVPRLQNLSALRYANSTAFATDGNDLWVNFFGNLTLNFVPGNNPPLGPSAADDTAQTDPGESVTIDVLGNDSGSGLTVRVGEGIAVADYIDDFQSPNAPAGWQYLWNQNGAFGNAANYSPLTWDAWRYRPGPSNFPYLFATGAHPGDGTSSGAAQDRFAIAAYTVQETGEYLITDSSITRSGDFGDGVEVAVHTTGTGASQLIQLGPESSGSFNASLGNLQVGDTIYLGVGPDGTGDGSSNANDAVNWDFTISKNQDTTTDAGAAISVIGSQILYDPGDLFDYLQPGQTATDTFTYTVQDGNGLTSTATVTVTIANDDGIEIRTFDAMDDAYIQQTSTVDNNLLRVEASNNRTRTAYLKFDVPNTPGQVVANA